MLLLVDGLDLLHLLRVVVLHLRLLGLHIILLRVGDRLRKGRGVLGPDRSGLLLLRVHLRLMSILGVNGDLGSEKFQRTIMATAGDHVFALTAAILHVLEPTGEAGDTGQADTDETEEGANNTVVEKLVSVALNTAHQEKI